MHELSIALNIIDLATEAAERHGGRIAGAIHIRLGPLSGVVKEALLSAYEIAREQTPLAESHLVVEDVPIVIYCEGCAAQKTVASMQSLVCPTCSTPASKVLSGNELEITALEIEA